MDVKAASPARAAPVAARASYYLVMTSTSVRVLPCPVPPLRASRRCRARDDTGSAGPGRRLRPEQPLLRRPVTHPRHRRPDRGVATGSRREPPGGPVTTSRPRPPADPAADDRPLLAVAVCGGQRCRALRALQDDRSPGTPPSDSRLRDAVRTTSRSMMLSTSCLGPCAQAAVVAVGWATMQDRSLAWLWPPVCWGAAETPQRAAALVDWLCALAPTLAVGPPGPAVLREAAANRARPGEHGPAA